MKRKQKQQNFKRRKGDVVYTAFRSKLTFDKNIFHNHDQFSKRSLGRIFMA